MALQLLIPDNEQKVPIVCVWMRTQLKMLNVGSRIHWNAIVPSAIGAAHGSRIRNRRIHRPRKGCMSACARMPAPSSTITCEMIVNQNVFQSACWKIAFAHSCRKFASPTQ